jgi:hypothetical protein
MAWHVEPACQAREFTVLQDGSPSDGALKTRGISSPVAVRKQVKTTSKKDVSAAARTTFQSMGRILGRNENRKTAPSEMFAHRCPQFG